MPEYVNQPDGAVRLGDHLLEHLSDPRWKEFRAAIAFVKRSGVKHLADKLRAFTEHGVVSLVVGVDQGGTSAEGLTDLFSAIRERGELYVFHNVNPSTFHPKVYYFRSETAADVIIGSGNLTEGGLFTNYEASVVSRLDLTNEIDAAFVRDVEARLKAWADPNTQGVLRVTDESLAKLIASGFLPEERVAVKEDESATRADPAEIHEGRALAPLFHRIGVQPAPRVPGAARAVRARERVPQPPDQYSGFVMTLQRTDVGVGQTTAGTSRRSPEVFIPLGARDFAPDFWGWPNQFESDSAKAGKMDRRGVLMWIGTEVVSVNMMTWPDRHDFRLRSEALRSAGRVGDILRIERAAPDAGFAYYVQIVPVGAPQYEDYASLCVNRSPNSTRRWGYY